MKVVIIGASDNPDRYSYKAASALLNKGFSILLVGAKNKTVFGHPIKKEVEFHDEPIVITLYVGPQNQNNYFQKIIEINPIKVIFNPGTENTAFQKLLDEANINWEEACTLVKLSLNQFP